MNIFENKRAFALTSVFALAFAGCATYGWMQRGELQDTIKKINEADAKLEKLAKSPLPATAGTKSLLNKQASVLERNTKPLAADLAAYTKTCKNLTEDAINKEAIFKPDDLKKARTAFTEKAAKANCHIDDPDSFTFGLDRNYNERNDAANPKTTPYLLYQLAAAKTLAGYGVGAGAKSLDRMYCEPVPTTEATGEPTPLIIELSFSFNRGEIPAGEHYTSGITKLLNSILEGKGENEKERFLFSVRGINFQNLNNYGTVDAYSDPFADGGDAPKSIADRKVGKPDETIRVNLIVEAVYF